MRRYLVRRAHAPLSHKIFSTLILMLINKLKIDIDVLNNNTKIGLK